MNPNEYQKLCERTECNNEIARYRFHNSPNAVQSITATRLFHAALGLGSESGELMSLLRRWIYYGKDLDLPKVMDELGDIAYFLATACNAVGVDMNLILAANVAKLRARYPDGFDEKKEERGNRDRDAEEAAVAAMSQRTKSQVLRLRETLTRCCTPRMKGYECQCLEMALPD